MNELAIMGLQKRTKEPTHKKGSDTVLGGEQYD
jgi:hypothetical protein